MESTNFGIYEMLNYIDSYHIFFVCLSRYANLINFLIELCLCHN